MSDYLDKIITKKKDGTQIASVPLQDADAQTRLGTVEGKLSTALTPISGNPISIPGLKSTQLAVDPVITFEPIQDLHGQSKPYPAGGGINKMPPLTTGTYSESGYTAVVSANGKITVSGANTGSSAVTISIPLASSITPSTLNAHLRNSISNASIAIVFGNFSTSLGDTNKIATINNAGTVSSIGIYFNNQVTGQVNFTLQPSIESDITVTDWSPYENICPISGYDKIEVLSCGKNLLDPIIFTNSVTYFTANDDGTVTQLNNDGRSESSMTTLLLDAGTYIISRGTTSGWMNVSAVIDGIFTDIVRQASSESIQFTITQRLALYIKLSVGGTYPLKLYPMIRLATITDATFEPYHKTTDLSESLGQTVYGGTLDVRTGVLTVDRAIYEFSGSETPIAYGSGYRYVVLTKLAKSYDADVVPNVISNQYSAVTRDGISQGNAGISVTNDTVLLSTDNPTGVKLVYELASPFTIQLTPHEISLLEQYAYVSTNGTTIALSYHQGEMASLGDVEKLGKQVSWLVESAQLEIINFPHSLFTWDSSSKCYKYSVALDTDRLLGFIVRATNGFAMMTGMYTSGGNIVVQGWIPSYNQSVDDTYEFVCYAVLKRIDV